ncbi:MAG: outer membrane protein transport protein [Anaerolineales bacterium]|nr:outer membrane protein transport protein [Anaerolineales bacterium]
MKINVHLKFSFFVLSLLCVVMSFPVSSTAQSLMQNIDISSSWNPVGSGARAIGMGGAFIGVADDATAASWNPAGLIQLEKPEVSIVGNYVYRKNDESYGTNPEADNSNTVNKNSINYFSVSYPFELFRTNMTLSINYQNLYEFNAGSSFHLSQREVEGINTWVLDRNINLEQIGNLYAIGLAYSVQLHPKLSVGVTLNFWEDWLGENSWKEKYHESATGTLTIDPPGPVLFTTPISRIERSVKDYEFEGFNANIGILWNVTEKLVLGGVLKTKFTADLDFSYSSSSGDSFKEKQRLDMPMSYGLGAAYRFSDAFTVSADVYRTEWQDFILTQADGTKVSPITGLSEQESGIDATIQVRIGGEYLLINPKYIVPLRAGLFYDPAPATGSPDDYYGFTLGSGLARGPWVFDIAYQFRWGDNIKESILTDFDYSSDVKEHQLYTSLIYHF